MANSNLKSQVVHVPLRMCIACRVKKPKKELIRLVLSEKGVVVDVDGKINGRGANICPSENCFSVAVERNIFSQTFKQNLKNLDIASLKKNFDSAIEQKKFREGKENIVFRVNKDEAEVKVSKKLTKK
ncbi:YlxR family protein [Candidatus Dojkabacteria bacterium]|nr:YlxR family protein [Candidatus Dojkabacteria bacterium]